MALDVTALCKMYKCDKSISRGQGSHSELYDKLFPQFRHKPITLLELGVNRQRSLRVWEEYFPQASIYGIDIRKRGNRTKLNRAVVEMLDQSDTKRLIKFAKEKGPFEIIIDDASHKTFHQISSFETLWPYIKPGGMYIIEDVETSYIRRYINSDQTCVEYFQNVTHELNKRTSKRKKLYKEIDTVMFRYNSIVVTKR